MGVNLMKMLHKSFHPVLPILKGLKFYNTYKELLPDLYIPEIFQVTSEAMTPSNFHGGKTWCKKEMLLLFGDTSNNGYLHKLSSS